LESIVKNCGGPIHKEVAQKDIMDTLKELAKVNNPKMRNCEDSFFRVS
jgi:growth factor-regulated tyrosine kinase substrate